MPELCRFYNIVIKMIFSDTDKHHELYAAWNKAVQNIPFGKIEPLR